MYKKHTKTHKIKKTLWGKNEANIAETKLDTFDKY